MMERRGPAADMDILLSQTDANNIQKVIDPYRNCETLNPCAHTLGKGVLLPEVTDKANFPPFFCDDE
jgi:hypothetical protein